MVQLYQSAGAWSHLEREAAPAMQRIFALRHEKHHHIAFRHLTTIRPQKSV
jgi:hypothetical protein